MVGSNKTNLYGLSIVEGLLLIPANVPLEIVVLAEREWAIFRNREALYANACIFTKNNVFIGIIFLFSCVRVNYN